MAFTEFDKEELKNLLKEVINETVEQRPLSDEEIQWVRLAIQVEAQRKAFRQAVIDKTLIGLLSSGGLAIAYYIIDFVKLHWK